MAVKRDKWTRWVEWLARLETGANCCNPYAFNWTQANKMRRYNLACYLREMAGIRPKLILIGEALGYRGGRVTGIPFSSAQVLATHKWYSHSHYRTIPSNVSKAEATASIVHDVLGQVGIRPLFWNAFPFHPHKANEPHTNRKPAANEIKAGGVVLGDLIEQMQIEVVVAVGKSAEKSLTQLQIPHQAIRHPSYGGKRDFHAGLLKIASSQGFR